MTHGSIIQSTALLALAGLLSNPAVAREAFCYIPGAGGGNAKSMEEVPSILNGRHTPFIAFDVGKTGNIQSRARIFTAQLSQELKADPELRCHVLAYSMGGITIRYAVNHLRVPDLVARRNRNVKEVIASITTLSTPHRGTPLSLLGRELRLPVGEGEVQLADDSMELFNSPSYPDTYSPIPTDLPFYSFRTWIPDGAAALDPIKIASFNILTEFLRAAEMDIRNDSVIPLDSQGAGKVLADLEIPHDYWANRTDYLPSPANFYGNYWHWLHGRVSNPAIATHFDRLD